MKPPDVIAYIVENRRKFISYAVSICGSRTLGEDIFQDAFLSVLKHAHQYRDGDNPSGWMMQIMLNRYRSIHRRRKFQAELPDEQFNYIEAFSESPFDQIYLDQVIGVLEKKIPNRLELIRAFINGMNYAEMAKEFGMAEGTVKSQLWRARDQINQLFPGEMQCSSRFKSLV